MGKTSQTTDASTDAAPDADLGLPPKTQFQADIDELRGRLAAVVAATSDAANVIISGIEDVLADAPATPKDRALDALSACVFHDIVGQHVARAAELLEIIERLGPPDAGGDAAKSRPDRSLANGPALTQDDGLDQTAVDGFFKR